MRAGKDLANVHTCLDEKVHVCTCALVCVYLCVFACAHCVRISCLHKSLTERESARASELF